MSSGYEDAQKQLMTQWEGITKIPERVWKNWPAFFGFAVVDYVSNIVYTALPANPGTNSSLNAAYQSVVRGSARTVDFVAWEALRTA